MKVKTLAYHKSRPYTLVVELEDGSLWLHNAVKIERIQWRNLKRVGADAEPSVRAASTGDPDQHIRNFLVPFYIGQDREVMGDLAS